MMAVPMIEITIKSNAVHMALKDATLSELEFPPLLLLILAAAIQATKNAVNTNTYRVQTNRYFHLKILKMKLITRDINHA